MYRKLGSVRRNSKLHNKRGNNPHQIPDDNFRQRLHSDPEYHPILMSEPAWNGKEKREKLIEVMFEKFNIPGKDEKPGFFYNDFSILPCQVSGFDSVCEWPS